MLNTVSLYKTLLKTLLNLSGLTQKKIQIQPGTTLNIWCPTKPDPKKPAILFLHGFAMDGITTWQFQVLSLLKNYAVYVPDFIFFGESVTDRSDRTVEFQCECVVKGLRELGVERCTVVGLSYGGMVGFKMMEMYEDFVTSMVVTCSVMALTESISDDGLKRIGFGSWSDYLVPKNSNELKIMFDSATFKPLNLPDFVYKHIFQAMYTSYRKERIELLEALVISDDAFKPHHYNQKIHLLWGKNDKIFDMETAWHLKEQIGETTRLEAIEKAGHIVNLERPFLYHKHLKQILTSFTTLQ